MIRLPCVRSDLQGRPYGRRQGSRRDRLLRGSVELHAKLGIAHEANRARCRVTHWMMPSAPARHPRNPYFLRALSDYCLVSSPLKTKMRVKSIFGASGPGMTSDFYQPPIPIAIEGSLYFDMSHATGQLPARKA
jgi:hypothetical protein